MLSALILLYSSCLAQDASKIKSALYVPDPLPVLDPKLHGTFEPAPEVLADRITYGTEYGMRVPAIVYRPKKSGTNRPAFIVVNGHGGDKYSWYAYWTGVSFARVGAIVLTYDPIGEGEPWPWAAMCHASIERRLTSCPEKIGYDKKICLY